MNNKTNTIKRYILSLSIMLGCALFVSSSLYAQGEKLIVSNEIAASGTEACVKFSVEGFTDVSSLTILTNVDITDGIATFSQATNFHPDLIGLTAANVMDLTVFGVSLVWEAPDPMVGVTLPNGTVIFEFCYDIVGIGGEFTDVSIIIGGSIQTFFGKTNDQDVVPTIMDGSITIPDTPPLLLMDGDILPDNCFDIDNGSVEITVDGGTTPYNFIWSDMSTDEDLTGVAAGMYSVTISDSSSPLQEIIATYTVPDDTTSPMADVGTINTITCADPIITIGGSNTSIGSEFVYQWLSPGVTFVSGQEESMAEVNTVGDYTFSVTNIDNGCNTESMITILSDTDGPNLDLGMDRTLTCEDGGMVLTAGNDQGLPNLSSSWDSDTGAVDEMIDDTSIRVSTPGTYTVELTNPANGCTSTGEVVITAAVLPTPALDGEVGILNCDISQIDISITKDDAHDVVWTTTGGTIDTDINMSMITVSDAGNYAAEVTDPNNSCTAIIEIEVTGNTEEPTVSAGDDLVFTCVDPIVNIMGTTDTPTGTIEWLDANNNLIGSDLTFDVNRAGTYILNVTNEFGCLRTDELIVTADTMAPIANAGVDFEVGCIGADIQLDGSASSTGQEFSYMWTTSNGILVSGFNSLTPSISAAGTYDLEVTNGDNGCSSLSTIVVGLEADLLLADAGEDFSTCEDFTKLAGNTVDNITGMWSTTSNGNIDNPILEDISISNLSAGGNIFVWTLSTADCADYSRDTVLVIFEGVPQAALDISSIPLDSTLATVNVLQNDNISNNNGVTVTYQTTDPNFMDLGDGAISYSFPNDSLMTFSVMYTVCSEVCPMLCDSALVTINREEPSLEPVELVGLPNVITPNGDGINDALIFDIMLTNADEFPTPELVVFNRWGDVVYKQKPYDNNWQGTNQTGGELPEGTYYFINRLNFSSSNTLTGDITIIRD